MDQGTDEATAEKRKRAERRSSAKFPLPTDRIAFVKQIEILRAYGQLGERGSPVSNAQIGSMVQLTASTASLANSFFGSIGLVQKSGDGQVPAGAVVDFARAHQWDSSKAPLKLAEHFRASWFGEELLPKIRFRSHSVNEAIAMLAEVSGAHPEQRDQLEALLNYLEYVGLIRRDGEMLLGVDSRGSDSNSTTEATKGDLRDNSQASQPDRPEGTQAVFVPKEFVVYRCKIEGGVIIEIPLPPRISKKDVARLTSFLNTQVDDDPEGATHP